MNWKNLRAGERRKLARNLEEHGGTIRIGIVGLSLVRMFLPILVVLGLAGLASASIFDHNSISGSHVSLASVGAIMVPGADFLKTMEESEKFVEVGRNHPGRKRVERFEEKLAAFLDLITNKKGYARHQREYLMREAETTSDFPILFGTVLERSLLANYSTQDSDWRSYIKTGTQKDFRAEDILGVYGLEGELTEVPERGEYKAAAMGEGKVSNVVKKYGKLFPISWETLVNDDLGAFNDVPQRLAVAASVSEYLAATRLFVGATGPLATMYSDTLAHPIDGAVFDNKGTAQLSADEIGNAITALRTVKNKDGNPIVVTRFHLVVPPALEIPALKALSSAALIAGGGSTGIVTSENVIAKLPITLHVNPYIPLIATTGNAGQRSWFIFAENPAGTPAAQMNFLRGHEQPEVVQKASDKVSLSGAPVGALEGDFATDSAAYRVRHIFGGTMVDPRFTWASDGSV